MNGGGNNLDNPNLGIAGSSVARLYPGDYTRLDDPTLPSGRLVSDTMFTRPHTSEVARATSDMLTNYGLLVGLDINGMKLAPSSNINANIPVPSNDEFFNTQASLNFK